MLHAPRQEATCAIDLYILSDVAQTLLCALGEYVSGTWAQVSFSFDDGN